MTNATTAPMCGAKFLISTATATLVCACGGNISTTGSPSPRDDDRPTSSSVAPLTGGNGSNGAWLAYGGQPSSNGTNYCITATTFAEGAQPSVAACTEPLAVNQAMFSLAGWNHSGFTAQQNVLASGWYVAIDVTCHPVNGVCSWTYSNAFLTHTLGSSWPYTHRVVVWTPAQGLIKATSDGFCLSTPTDTIGPQPNLVAKPCAGTLGQAWQGVHFAKSAMTMGNSFLAPNGLPYYLSWNSAQFVGQGLPPYFASADSYDSNGFGIPGPSEYWNTWSNFFFIQSGATIASAGLTITPDTFGTSWWLIPNSSGVQYQSGLDVNTGWTTIIAPGWSGLRSLTLGANGQYNCLQLPAGSGISEAPCQPGNTYQNWYLVYE